MTTRAHRFHDVWTPDGGDINRALERVTHLAIGAHQDDLEIMAFHGIQQCYRRADLGFCGVVCTSGAGSPRSESQADVPADEWVGNRSREQREAARIGDYAALVQLGYPSSAVRSSSPDFLESLDAILDRVKPRIIYTHNLADRHPTHVATALAVIKSLRGRSGRHRPDRVLGCEVWRDLDWLSESDRVALDVSGQPDLARRLVKVFQSQIDGGKRYDAAVIGRRQAQATFARFDSLDESDQVVLAMDLTPLLDPSAPSPQVFVDKMIARFQDDVRRLLDRSSA